MANFTNVDERVENKSEKRVRIFLAVMFFIQTVFTTTPFMQGKIVQDGKEVYNTLTAFNLLVNPGGYENPGAIPLAFVGGILVIFPIVAFFFCVLDSKSRVKYIISGLCSIICAMTITFSIASVISIGAIITLVINVICLFMTSQGFQATSMRMKSQQH